MNIKLSAMGTLAYVIVTFPLAIVWHVILFEELYQRFGYFDGEPNYLLGLISIVIQAGILSFGYPYVSFAGQGITKGIKFGLVGGALIWTTHVLAFVAKQDVADAGLFVAMESVYLLLQFGIYGVLIGLIYRKAPTLSDRTIELGNYRTSR